MSDFDFSGFMLALQDIEITPPTSMITTEGGLIDGHIVKLTFGDGSETFFSAQNQQLQKLFFLILKVVNG